MGINWKLRFKNPYFYVYLLLSIVAPVGVYFGVNAEDLTTWAMVGDLFKQAVSNPYVIITVVMSVAAFIIDPTTKGIKDSKRALGYEKLKGDE